MTPTCQNHKKDILGISDMKELARMIGDLHYETLTELLFHLSVKMHEDGKKDCNAGRIELGLALQNAGMSMEWSKGFIYKAWHISKPFMEAK